ncbi:MAG: chorismate mutase [Spirochaetaceae bacterium]|jgi:chorismate mutase|nr:chorismate mutase [Spirochaetaceae bacterium]
MKKLRALRGAFCCPNNGEDIIRETTACYDRLLRENLLAEEDIVSLLFSVTPDIDALNPAAALRRAGRGRDLALFVQQEPVFRDSLRQVIRVLIHCYMEEGKPPRHVYQNGAEILRPDRSPGPAAPP